jgi:hypothetical protein
MRATALHASSPPSQPPISTSLPPLFFFQTISLFSTHKKIIYSHGVKEISNTFAIEINDKAVHVCSLKRFD